MSRNSPTATPEAGKVRRAELLAEIRPGRAETDPLFLEGWGQAEGGHRWALGATSTMRLPLAAPVPDCVLAIDMVPWCDRKILPAQTISIAINGSHLATVRVEDQRVLAFRCAGLPASALLSFTHHAAQVPRPAELRQTHGGAPLGVMLVSLRIFRLNFPPFTMLTRGPFLGNLCDGVLARDVQRATGQDLKTLATGFENIGHNCELGLMQRELGAEPVSLLRFAAVVTHRLVDSLIDVYDGLGDPDKLVISVVNIQGPEYQIHETNHRFWYEPQMRPGDISEADLRAQQTIHLRFMRRKFKKTIDSAEKIYGISRGRNLTEPEALAIWCALNLHADNTLLWAINGDVSQTGRVDALLPGFLRGHLGATDDRKYGTLDAWINLMANAWLLRQGIGEHAIFMG